MSSKEYLQRFARGAVRQTIEAKNLGEQRTRIKQMSGLMRTIFQTTTLYARFERIDTGRFTMVFHNEEQYLLGETVRNWLKRRVSDDTLEEDAEKISFVWSEKIGNEFALVGIMGREVVAESVANERTAGSEIQQLMGAIEQRSTQVPPLYLYNTTPEKLGIDAEIKWKELNVSIQQGVEDEDEVLLQNYTKALNQLTSKRRLVLLIAVVLPALMGALSAIFFLYVQPRLAELGKPKPVKTSEEFIEEYRQNASAPDPALLLASLYQSYAKFVTQPFARQWSIYAIGWSDSSPGSLRLDANFRGSGELPADFLTTVQDWATGLGQGSSAQIYGTGLRFSVPVHAQGRPEAARTALFYTKHDGDGGFDPGAIAENIEAAGEAIQLTETGGRSGAGGNDIFRTDHFTINIRNVVLEPRLMLLLGTQIENAPTNLASVSLSMDEGLITAGAVNFKTLSQLPSSE